MLDTSVSSLLEDHQFEKHLLFYKKPLPAKLLDVESQESDSDKLEFEHWPHVTLCKSWKSAFRREVITSY